MSVIKVENLSKQYRLGQVGTGSLSHDINRLWHRARGKEDPYLKIGEENNRETKGNSDYVWALKDINFEIEQGDRVGIIGRNGAGKSTLLKILSRTTSPTSGSVKIKGKVASLLEVGTGFHPDLSGRDNIFLNGAILGMSKRDIKSRFDEIVDFAGVERYIDTPVKRYSSGMYVRLAFAVAAHLESDILIVDEVLAVGDVEFQKKCLGKMGEGNKGEGKTIVFVSHNMAAVRILCKQVIVLQNGIKSFAGNLKEGQLVYLNSLKNFTNEDSIQEKLVAKNDELFELMDIQVSQEDTQGVEFFSNKKIKILFNYRVHQRINGLRIGFDLIDQSTDITIFRTFHDDSSDKISTFYPGIYNSEAYINSDFLKPGTYIINLAIGIHQERWIYFDEIKLKINVHNIDGVNKLYGDNRPGFIMPQIKWLTKEHE